MVIYCEIDSWIPTEIAPFLSKGKEPREFNGVKGEKLKTIRLRGQVSQGLLLPLRTGIGGYSWLRDVQGEAHTVNEDDDVTELLGIQKWEAPLNAQLAGQARGNFPSFIRKTDQERIQNIKREFEDYKVKELRFECSEKLEGSSMTVYLKDGVFGVCSRNIDLKESEENTFWKVARELNLEEKMIAYGKNIAVQGELIGPGIQGNIYGLTKPEFRVFDIFDIDGYTYVDAVTREDIIQGFGIEHVPVLGVTVLDVDMSEVIASADGKSRLSDTLREGIVFKCISNPEISFKVISNLYLLGEK